MVFENAETNLNQIHVWHDCLDLSNNFCLASSINLLQLYAEYRLFFRFFLRNNLIMIGQGHPKVSPTSTGAASSTAAAAPATGADAAGIAISVMFSRVFLDSISVVIATRFKSAIFTNLEQCNEICRLQQGQL
jgi:hypothetical protein